METLGYRPAAWLVGNKKDQGGRKVDAAEAEGKAKILGVNYVETSAKTGENVEELFKAVLRGVVKLRLGEVERALEG
jgi:GTPase SAR1 family protein